MKRYRYIIYTLFSMYLLYFLQGVYISNKYAQTAQDLYNLERKTALLKLENTALEVVLSEVESLQYIGKKARDMGFQEPRKGQIINIWDK